MSLLTKSAVLPADPDEGVRRFRKTAGAVLLDVRSPEEYEQGHIPGSINLPLNRLAAIAYDRETPLFVYCHSGARSARACDFLTRQGYTAENLGGLINYHGTLE